MGGLLSKLQVTSSGNRLWREFATVPIEKLDVDPDVRKQLHRAMFFEPSPSVRRVVYIGTPHHGSSLAARPLARLASSAVHYSPEQAMAYSALVLDNAEHIRPWAWMGHPTSVDMLLPDNPVLSALDKMPYGEGVTYHVIVGTQGHFVDGRSDSIVSIPSAKQRGAASEVYVNATHTGLLQHSTTVAELLRIFEEHAECVPRVEFQNAPPATSTPPRENEFPSPPPMRRTVPRTDPRVDPRSTPEEVPPRGRRNDLPGPAPDGAEPELVPGRPAAWKTIRNGGAAPRTAP